jgi:hypothetical protein
LNIQKWFTVLAIIVVLVVNISCSSITNYTRIDNPGWFGVDYPEGFEYTISPHSMGSTPEVDFVKKIPVEWTSTNGSQKTILVDSIGISVFGVNGDYADVVNYDNTKSSSRKGHLIQRGEVLSIFTWVNENSNQQIYIDCDLGELRTGVVWGVTYNMSEASMDDLTRYCMDIANSLKASIDWISDGLGRD